MIAALQVLMLILWALWPSLPWWVAFLPSEVFGLYLLVVIVWPLLVISFTWRGQGDWHH